MTRRLLAIHASLAIGGVLLCLAPSASAQISISEIRTDQPGSDVDEYFELSGPAGRELNGYTYLVVGDGTGGSGVLESAIDLSALQMPPDGVAFVAEAGFSLGPVPDLVSVINFENADNVTHLVVVGFNGSVGSDLDVDDDGALDIEPWDRIDDCLSILDSADSGDLTYCDRSVGPDGASAPAHVYLDGGWQIGPADPAVGVDTPGTAPIGLAVEVSRFHALVRGRDVLLSWTSSGTGDVVEYRIRDAGREVASVRPDNTIPVITGPRRQYGLTLSGVAPGLHTYSLFLVYSAGTESMASRTDILVPPGDDLLVTGPFPNPASRTARISVYSDIQQPLEITLFDAIGRRMQQLYAGEFLSGHMDAFRIELALLPPGVYFVAVRGRRQTVTKALVLRG